jgi:hypothetical protein
MPLALFALIIFLIGSLFYAWAVVNKNLPTYTFHVRGMTDVCHCVQLLFVEMGVSLTVCMGWPQTGIILTSASRIIGIIGMSRYASSSVSSS